MSSLCGQCFKNKKLDFYCLYDCHVSYLCHVFVFSFFRVFCFISALIKLLNSTYLSRAFVDPFPGVRDNDSNWRMTGKRERKGIIRSKLMDGLINQLSI